MCQFHEYNYQLHLNRTVISDLQRTPDSMVVHAYILLDPDKDNLYHSYTVWFSSEGFVRFGKWILFPANVHVERALVVPDRYMGKCLCSNFKHTSILRYWKYLSDRSYIAPMAFDTSNPLFTTTVPAFFCGSAVIILFMGTLSFCHWLAYVKDHDKMLKINA